LRKGCVYFTSWIIRQAGWVGYHSRTLTVNAHKKNDSNPFSQPRNLGSWAEEVSMVLCTYMVGHLYLTLNANGMGWVID
jgi:hypothetical protein